MAVLTIPKILREKLSDDGAEALVELFDKVEASAHDNTLEVAEEKFEKRLAQFQGVLETKVAEVKGEMVALRAEVKSEIAVIDEKFEKRLAQVKAELLKWMFIFVWSGGVDDVGVRESVGIDNVVARSPIMTFGDKLIGRSWMRG